MPSIPIRDIAERAGTAQARDRLRALRLDLLPNRRGSKARPLAGLAVLAIGCDEGLVRGEAQRQRPRRLVRIDADEMRDGSQEGARMDQARALLPGAALVARTGCDLPAERFDVIMLLSGLEDEADPAAFLKHLADHLAPGGTLVVECGLSRRPGRRWQAIADAGAVRRYPTHALFVDQIARPFAVRVIGPGAIQADARIERQVYHCAVKQGVVLLVAGPSGAGKSMLASEFRRLAIPVLRTDDVLAALLRQPRYDGLPLAAAIRRSAGATPPHFGRIGDIVAARWPEAFVTVLLDAMPKVPDLVCIEGEILRHRNVRDPLVAHIRSRGLRPWDIAPPSSGAAAAASRASDALRGACARALLAVAQTWTALRTRARPSAASDEDASKP